VTLADVGTGRPVSRSKYDSGSENASVGLVEPVVKVGLAQALVTCHDTHKLAIDCSSACGYRWSRSFGFTNAVSSAPAAPRLTHDPWEMRAANAAVGNLASTESRSSL
jgi:hypothetical protein